MTNTNDFIWHLVKGRIQIGLVPDISNAVNMAPVDHVMALVAAASCVPFIGSLGNGGTLGLG